MPFLVPYMGSNKFIFFYAGSACKCASVWPNKFCSAWEDEYIYMFTSHSAVVSTFKWHFCPDKYWKWTRTLCAVFRVAPFCPSLAFQQASIEIVQVETVRWTNMFQKFQVGLGDCNSLNQKYNFWNTTYAMQNAELGAVVQSWKCKVGQARGSRYKLTAGGGKQKLIKSCLKG